MIACWVCQWLSPLCLRTARPSLAQRFCDEDVSLEVEPLRYPEATRKADVERSLASLRSWSGEFANAICGEASLRTMPAPLRAVCAALHQRVGESAAPRMRAAIVGAYLVLRFFNPALVSPNSPVEKGLRDGRVLSAANRRSLMLIAKVLQASSPI
jgi:hypothetical protein